MSITNILVSNTTKNFIQAIDKKIHQNGTIQLEISYCLGMKSNFRHDSRFVKRENWPNCGVTAHNIYLKSKKPFLQFSSEGNNTLSLGVDKKACTLTVYIHSVQSMDNIISTENLYTNKSIRTAKLADFVPETNNYHNGVHYRLKFAHYEMTIIRNLASYGNSKGLYEVGLWYAHSNFTGRGCTMPPITEENDNVRGWLTEKDVDNCIQYLQLKTKSHPVALHNYQPVSKEQQLPNGLKTIEHI